MEPIGVTIPAQVWADDLVQTDTDPVQTELWLRLDDQAGEGDDLALDIRLHDGRLTSDGGILTVDPDHLERALAVLRGNRTPQPYGGR